MNFSGYRLSKFSYNDRGHNSLIVDRRPDYGDGHKDGCIIMSEMHLKVKSIAKDSILFEVKDVDSQKPVMATIEVLYNVTDKTVLQTDSLGFALVKSSSDIKIVKVSSLGYRWLVVDLIRFRRL
jgi:hypothetical protein